MSRKTRRELQDDATGGPSYLVPLMLSKFECSICRGPLNTSGNVWFCPHCLSVVMHESPDHTKAREQFFAPLFDEDDWRKGRPVEQEGVMS